MLDDIAEILESSKALQSGHFLLTSGLHSPKYIEKFRILQFPSYTEHLCTLIADQYRDKGIEAVAGPALGGIILAYEVAKQLEARSIFAERFDGKRVFRRGLSIAPGEKVLVVDDILTTGGSIREVLDAVKEASGEAAGIGVFIGRSGDTTSFDIPFYSCCQLSIPTYKPEECPLCAEGEPLTRPGGNL